MRSKDTNHIFWLSYSDLLTSLFFIVLVLYAVTFYLLKIKENDLQETIELQKRHLEIITTVENNLKPLKEDIALFKYEPEYRRFILGFDVAYKVGMTDISETSLKDYDETVNKINKAGEKLFTIIQKLSEEKFKNQKFVNVSYLVVISGYASRLEGNYESIEYQRSYERAYKLWMHWKRNGIDLEQFGKANIIDLQISGNGWGGIGRYEYDPQNNFKKEMKNQRFIIQIVPKIGDFDQV